MYELLHFDLKYLDKAAELLQKQYLYEMKKWEIPSLFSRAQSRAIIKAELEKNGSHALMILVDDQFAGYMISTIKKDLILGDKGWVNLGAWAIENHAIDTLGYLYKQIADAWVKKGIVKHIILSFAGHRETIDSLNELGFAKQQTHGLMHCDPNTRVSSGRSGKLVFRRAVAGDQLQISSFSRVIADYQSQSPCYAPAPEEYLLKLDKGFSQLTEDEEGDLYVVEKGGLIIGYQMYFPCEGFSLIEPENCTELAVSAVKEEFRGQGAGYYLTEQSLNDQIARRRQLFSTDWRCANLKSSRFWRNIGFKPLAYRLFRQIETL